MHQGPRDGHPLHLAARELARETAEFLPHAQGIQDLAGAADGPVPRPAGDHQRDRCVLGGGQGRQQVVLLEHKPDIPGSESSPHPVAHRRERLAEDLDIARVAVEDPGDDRQERRLAAARGADDQRHLTGVHVPIQASQRMDPLFATAEMLGEPANPYRDRRGRNRVSALHHVIDCRHRRRGLHQNTPGTITCRVGETHRRNGPIPVGFTHSTGTRQASSIHRGLRNGINERRSQAPDGSRAAR